MRLKTPGRERTTGGSCRSKRRRGGVGREGGSAQDLADPGGEVRSRSKTWSCRTRAAASVQVSIAASMRRASAISRPFILASSQVPRMAAKSLIRSAASWPTSTSRARRGSESRWRRTDSVFRRRFRGLHRPALHRSALHRPVSARHKRVAIESAPRISTAAGIRYARCRIRTAGECRASLSIPTRLPVPATRPMPSLPAHAPGLYPRHRNAAPPCSGPFRLVRGARTTGLKRNLRSWPGPLANKIAERSLQAADYSAVP